MKDSSSNDELFRVAMILTAATSIVLFLGGWIVFFTAKVKARKLAQSSMLKTLISGTALIALGLAVMAVSKQYKHIGLYAKLGALLGLWIASGGAVLSSAPLWVKTLLKQSITPDDLKTKVSTTLHIKKIGQPGKSIIGSSLKTTNDVYLTESERVMHTLIAGSTGSGKTTLLKSLYIDACKKGQPVVIVDPKGNNKTVEEFRELAISMGVDPKKFRLFSIINPTKSQAYNPLARGSAIQIRDRLMGALEWSEQFYKNQASSWLGLAIEILKALEMKVSVRLLHKLLTDKKTIDVIDKHITKLENKERAAELTERLKALIKAGAQNQDNLITQLRDLDNIEFGHLLQPADPEGEIDLANAIANNEILYFQLNVMAYEVSATSIGKLLLQDLKSLASQIHGGVLDLEPKFTPIFVDEFGSFAIEGFIDYLKMSRDVKLANHLFFQSLADLDAVSPEFKSQVQANCKTKIILRTDDPNEVDFWSGVAGTIDAIEASHQTEKIGPFTMKTGAGNARFTKQMKVEHDAFKQLEIGQAVIIQKAPALEDLVQLWLPNTEEIIAKKAS